MNALELADELDKYKGIATRDAATMLRQQHAEIEALKLQLHTTLTNRNLEKPAKYSDAWWKEVAEFNKARKAQK